MKSGADAVIVDIEDAVAERAKPEARAHLADAAAVFASSPVPVVVRINAAGTRWHDGDVSLCRELPIAAIMLAKTESRSQAAAARQNTGKPVLGLIESAMGIARLDEICGACIQLAFGSVDFVEDIGAMHERDALLGARSAIVLASRIGGLAAPLDGVTTEIGDEARVEDDARYGRRLGFGGKLLIHPAQVEPARRGLSPSGEEIAWAERILALAGEGTAMALDGHMIDTPVVKRAERIRQLAGRANQASPFRPQ